MATCHLSQRPMIALTEKGIDFQLKKVACARGEPKDPELSALFAAVSPGDAAARVMVPLLEHEENDDVFRMIESGPICEYIDETWPDRVPLWPRDSRKRYAMRLFMDTADSADFVGPLWTVDNFAEKIREHASKLKLINCCLEKHASPGGDFFLGDQFSMVEVMFAPLLQRWKVAGELIGFHGTKLAEDLGLDRFVRWMKATFNRPSVVSTFPEEVFAKMRFDAPLNITYDIVGGDLTNIKVGKA
eukprot:TRINITY_DN6860_c0_g1_i2.p1 TRINITY_DN6860_c0_g1~~TRINITY_DN6860_c0_g1_i2.p1  ORF type:complete len:278 (+),score=49.65 TRINITY_DN6860_c0_g1_i2:100-834(+)